MIEKSVRMQTEEELTSALIETLESIVAGIVDYEQNKTTDWAVERQRAKEIVKSAYELADDTLYSAMESGAVGVREKESILWEALEEISLLKYLNVLSAEELVSRMARIISRAQNENQPYEEIRTYALRFLLGHKRHAPKYPRDAVRIASVLIPRDQLESGPIWVARVVLQKTIYAVMKEHPAGNWGIRDIAEELRSKARGEAEDIEDMMESLLSYDAIITTLGIVERFEELERKWEREAIRGSQTSTTST